MRSTCPSTLFVARMSAGAVPVRATLRRRHHIEHVRALAAAAVPHAGHHVEPRRSCRPAFPKRLHQLCRSSSPTSGARCSVLPAVVDEQLAAAITNGLMFVDVAPHRCRHRPSAPARGACHVERPVVPVGILEDDEPNRSLDMPSGLARRRHRSSAARCRLRVPGRFTARPRVDRPARRSASPPRPAGRQARVRRRRPCTRARPGRTGISSGSVMRPSSAPSCVAGVDGRLVQRRKLRGGDEAGRVAGASPGRRSTGTPHRFCCSRARRR